MGNIAGKITILMSVLFLLVSCQKEDKFPKNILIFISDGCGYYQVDAASLYENGERGIQIYEQFPVKLAMSTYPANGHGYEPDKAWKSFDYVLQKPTDSAASATALSTGVLTNNGALGVDTTGVILPNIMEMAEKRMKSTGVVSSVMFSHATPSGFLVHNSSRHNYRQIARDMITRSKADVIMGCGHPLFDKTGQATEDTSFKYVGSESLWDSLKAGTVGNEADGHADLETWELIEDYDSFIELADGPAPERVIGVPKIRSTLQFDRPGDKKADAFDVPFIENIPTLGEMTETALNVLDNNERGFVIMVEGGAVDWAGHANSSGRLIEEEMDFNRAVEVGVNWVEENSSWEETLVIVTGDHETGYLTGPGSNPENKEGMDYNEIWKPLQNNGMGEMPGMEWHSGGHTNSLIPFYAKGFGSELFIEKADEEDPVRGNFLDNAEVGKVLTGLYSR
ncbi:MAG: alkaline phosphatase [Caldithrix sp.]|nr:alkaline phosphatase [Caldithrix sp.]